MPERRGRARPRSDAADPGVLPGSAVERLGAVALGGALGTLVRVLAAVPLVLVVDGLGWARLLVVNVIGAGVLGVLVARRATSPVLQRRWPLLATGLLGGATTFSSMVVAAGRLGHELGLVDPGSARMRPSGLALSLGYLAASVLLGLAAHTSARRLAAP